MIIRKAKIDEVKNVVNFIDSTFTKEGYGFVTPAQIKTEINRKSVWICEIDNKIVGVRVGINRVYNLAVHKDYRKKGIGKALIDIHRPESIRVKAIPVGHMSKKQKEEFLSPEPFYKKIGYKFAYMSYPKNIWAGQVKNKLKRVFIKQGKLKHIKVYEDTQNKQLKLF